MDEKVTQHFSWSEVTRKSGAKSVPAALRPGVRRHARNLERLRARINNLRRTHGFDPTGIAINSWYRTPKHNREVGGAKFSKHMFGIATDITREEVRRLMPWKGGAADFDRVADEVFKKGGFGQYPGGARHVDSRRYRARWTSY